MHHAGALPDTILADITARDRDGDLIATPDEWDEDAERPRAENPRPRPAQAARPREAAGIGDRVLLRIEATDDEDGTAIAAASSAFSTGRSSACSAFSTPCRGGGGRIEPVDKKMLGKELTRPAARRPATRRTATWSRSKCQQVDAARPAARQDHGTARLAENREGGQHDRDRGARHPFGVPQRHADRGRGRKAGHDEGPRRLARPRRSSPSIRPTPRITTTPFTPSRTTTSDNKGGFVLTVAIADVAHYVTPGSALDREALVRGNSVYFPDRVVPMLPERISNDLCSLRPQGRARRARRAHGHRRRRPQALAHASTAS